MEFKRILAAINGTKIDEEIIKLACNLARPNKSKVFVTYVIEVDRTLPVDADHAPAVSKAEQSLSAAEHYAQDCKYKVSTDLLQARAVGPALVNEANERDVDLILLGMTYKTQYGEFSMGDIIPYILEHAPCRVMILRAKIPLTENNKTAKT